MDQRRQSSDELENKLSALTARSLGNAKMNLSSIGFLCAAVATGAAMAQPAKVLPAEWKTFPSLVSDYTVVELTTDKAEDIRLYFYNDGFIPSTAVRLKVE
jgi:hypothetical protein